MSMNPPLFKYRPDIDGLRAIAVLSVVIFHAFPQYFQGGFVGVDVFFVISGYLISCILFLNLERNEFNLFVFYSNRVKRIFPALILVLCFCLMVGYFMLYDEEYKNLAKHVLSGSGFMSNVVLWKEAGYFDQAAELKPLLHLWSLGIEEQFYIIWPCFLFLIWRRAFNPWICMIALFLVSFVLNVINVRHHAVLTFYSPFMRAWELLFGALLAYVGCLKEEEKPWFLVIFQKHTNRVWINNLRASIGFLLLALSMLILNKSMLFPGWWALLPTLGAVLLIASPESLINRVLLSNPLFVGIGLISYPLYLWHWPLFAFLHIIFSGKVPVILSWLVVITSFFLAFVTYQWVEKPIRFAKNANKSIFPLCTALLITGSIGWYVYQDNGLKSRALVASQEGLLRELTTFYDYKKEVSPCAFKDKGYDALSWCFQTREGKADKVIWGDSHAEHLFPGVFQKDMETNWLVIGQSSCPPLSEVEVFPSGKQDVCVKSNQLALKAIIDSPSIKTVVLASLGPFYITDEGYAAQHLGADNSPARWTLNPRFSMPETRSKADVFYRGMDLTVTQLEALGKQVILYQDVPEVPFMPIQCLKRPFDPTVHACRMILSEVIQRQTDYKRLLLKLKEAHPHVKIFDPTPYLCDASTCYVRKEEKFIYRDAHHLSSYGSLFLAQHFMAWLKE